MKKERTLEDEFKIIKDIFEPRDEQGELIEVTEVFETGGELDILCHKFINRLGGLTLLYGYDCEVEGVEMDLWKSRVWGIVESAGLLTDK